MEICDTTAIAAAASAHRSGSTRHLSYLDGNRDLRIDFIRGLAMLSVLAIHFEYLTPISFLFWERVGVVTGAELFVLCSGIAFGLARKRQLVERGLLAASSSAWYRAGQIYVVLITVSFAVQVLSLVPGVSMRELTSAHDSITGISSSLFPSAGSSLELVFNDILMLKSSPHQIQVLGLYFFLLLLAPLPFAALRAGKIALLLGISTALWLVGWYWKVRLTNSQFERSFPILAWQLLFVYGMTLGFHWKAVSSWLVSKSTRHWRLLALVMTVVFAVFSWNHPLPSVPAEFTLHWIAPGKFMSLYQGWFSKSELGPGRVVNLVALFIVLTSALALLWTHGVSWVALALVPLGQVTLYIFTLHIVILGLFSQFKWHSSQGTVGEHLLLQALLALLVTLAVRTRFLFSLIPR